MANMFDEPAAVVVSADGVVSASVPVAVSTPVVNAPAPPVQKKPRNLARPAAALSILIYGCIVLGAFGLVFPGSTYVDFAFQAIGKWFFEVVSQSSFTNTGYVIVASFVALVTLTWITARNRK